MHLVIVEIDLIYHLLFDAKKFSFECSQSFK